MEKKVEEAMKLVEESTRNLSKALKILAGIVGEEIEEAGVIKLEEWQLDRVEFWCRVYNKHKTGIVSKAEYHEIAKKMGYDTRGLGGFFTGDKSLTWSFDGKNVSLTPTAKEKVERWTGEKFEEYAKKFEK